MKSLRYQRIILIAIAISSMPVSLYLSKIWSMKEVILPMTFYGMLVAGTVLPALEEFWIRKKKSCLCCCSSNNQVGIVQDA